MPNNPAKYRNDLIIIEKKVETQNLIIAGVATPSMNGAHLGGGDSGAGPS
jgi:hypothetical protein